MSNALDIALAVGQRLNIAKDQVGEGKWSKWLRDNCELSRSTALLYMRLANHQGDIDAARVQLPNLSLRAARRLLTKSIEPEADPDADQEEADEADDKSAPDHTAGLQAMWQAAPVEAQEAFLAVILPTIKVSDLIKRLSSEQIADLAQRAEQNRPRLHRVHPLTRQARLRSLRS
jgi:hypothetical protein